MKTLERYNRGDHGYDAVCEFAHDVYEKDLSFDLTHFPETLFAITEGETVLGCIGLNADIRFPLFRNDPRLVPIMEEHRGAVFGEQSILALRNCIIGLPVLIANAAAYGNYLGMDKILYAAIPVSQKTIQSLGFTTMTYGPADPLVFSENERPLYARWFAHNPICCVLDTHDAPAIFEQVLTRFSRRLELGEQLYYTLNAHMVRAA